MENQESREGKEGGEGFPAGLEAVHAVDGLNPSGLLSSPAAALVLF
jgi:hypothetical protein